MHQTKKNIYIVTELANGEQLYRKIVKEEKIKQQQQTIQYLHQNYICHRDIKPQNIIVDNNRKLKLIDFGLSNKFNQQLTLKTSCGSPCYAAPQMLTNRQYNPIKTDIWALGITLYAMIAGKLPFQHQKTQKLYKLISIGQYQQPKNISSSLQNLLKKIIQVNPYNRISISQIKSHQWIQPYLIIKTIQQKQWNISLIQSMSKLFHKKIQQIIQIIKSNSSQPIATYYFLLNKNKKISKFNQSNNKQWKIYNGPIHLNYVFENYDKINKWIELNLPKSIRIQYNLINYQGLQIEIKKIRQNEDIFYLQLPFYYVDCQN